VNLVEKGEHFPGACLLGGGHERLVDFQRTNVHGERVYVAQQLVADAARLMGFIGPRERATLDEDASVLQQRLDQAEAELEDLRALKDAIAYTLERGVVIDKRSGKIKLRPAPGQKAPVL
jgi:hypothetical protein